MTTAPTTTKPDITGASAHAEIDLDTLTANVVRLREIASSARLMAVVKADAYGHGLVPCARAALRGGADWLGIAQLNEALELRRAGIDAPLLTWLYVPGADVAGALAANIDVTVSAPWQLAAAEAAARASGRAARIHLKVDTGLGRNGALGPGWTDLIAETAPLAAEGVVDVVGIWTHFAYADAPDHPTVRGQQVRFAEAVAEAKRAGIRPEMEHMANSAATLTNPSAHLDMVRPGLAVYGLSPVPDLGTPETYGLREVMKVTARLALVKRARAGQGLSYGHVYTTTRDTVLGLVPMGYADGVPRDATNVAPVQIGEQRTTIAGRVCMDQFVVDLGPDFGGSAGDEVVLFGRRADGEPTAQDWANATDTISYEIVTRLGSRVPRHYVGSDV